MNASDAESFALQHGAGFKKEKPTGWDDNGGRTRAYHWFGADGRSLCGKWANLSWNLLLSDKAVHADHRCKTCDRKHPKHPKHPNS